VARRLHSAAKAPAKKKPRGKPFQKGEDVRRNAGGRIHGSGIAKWMREFTEMTPAEAAEACAVYADRFKKMGEGGASLGAMIAACAILGLVDDPDPRLLSVVLDRVDGKVPVKVETEDWRAKAVRAIAEGKIDRVIAERVFGKEETKTLFEQAAFSHNLILAGVGSEDEQQSPKQT
jgi:hypothetical protein